MTKFDFYRMSNRAWWEFRNHIPVVKESAPPEEKASEPRYREQVKNRYQRYTKLKKDTPYLLR